MKRRLTIAPVIIATFLLLTASIAAALFNDTTSNTGNSFTSNASLYGPYSGMVTADQAAHYWRLGGNGSGATTVSNDGFDSEGEWTEFRGGKIETITNPTDPSDLVLHKHAGNSPDNGTYKTLTAPIANQWTLQAWLYRTGTGNNGNPAVNSISISNGANGYSVTVDHTTNQLRIERRNNASVAATLNSTPFNPPESTFYKTRLVRSGNTLTASVFDASDTIVTSVTATDATITAFDTLYVQGANGIYINDLTVGVPSSTPTAPDEITALNGTYVGTPTYSQPALIFGSTNPSVPFNASSRVTLPNAATLNSNAGGYAAKSVELWFNTSNVTTRQILWEQGGSTAGMNMYVDNGLLYARAWSSGWAQTFQITSPISANTTYHVVMTLDAMTTRTFTLYINGQQVSSATKTDSNALAVHTNSSAIGGLNGETLFHDGPVTTGSYGFLGRIDEVAHYNNIVLSANTVLSHYGAGT